MTQMRRLMRQQAGQGMTEYIIIVSLIAISCIVVVAIFGDNIRKIFGASTDALANSATATTSAKTSGPTSEHKDVTTFADQNH
jgi:pilus assembly protein Flp/PilA